jgi:hypothetical protein
MAKKTTLTVTTPHGTFTRETNRPYAYIVVARGSRLDYLTRNNQGEVVNATKNLAYERQCLAELEGGFVRYEWNGTREAQIANAQECIAANLAFLAPGAAQAKLAAEIAASDARLLAPFSEKGGQWSSRLDLAIRVANDMATTCRDVRIFDVATGAQVWERQQD